MQRIGKRFNYKIVVEFGNGKEYTFKTERLNKVFLTSKELAEEGNTFFLRAKVFPLSLSAKAIIKENSLTVDTLGNYHLNVK